MVVCRESPSSSMGATITPCSTSSAGHEAIHPTVKVRSPAAPSRFHTAFDLRCSRVTRTRSWVRTSGGL